MTNISAMLGIPPAAMPAWVALVAALDRLADQGRVPVCSGRPEQWSADARPPARRDAAEACVYCPVLHPCAAYAEAAGEAQGVWGGVDRSAAPVKRRQAAS